MHKFNLEIEIPDKDYCNRCACLNKVGYGKDYSVKCKLYILHILRKAGQMVIRPDICKQNDKPIQEFIKQYPTDWDDLSYNQKEELRKRNPELWKKLYRQKYGLGN